MWRCFEKKAGVVQWRRGTLSKQIAHFGSLGPIQVNLYNFISVRQVEMMPCSSGVHQTCSLTLPGNHFSSEKSAAVFLPWFSCGGADTPCCCEWSVTLKAAVWIHHQPAQWVTPSLSQILAASTWHCNSLYLNDYTWTSQGWTPAGWDHELQVKMDSIAIFHIPDYSTELMWKCKP